MQITAVIHLQAEALYAFVTTWEMCLQQSMVQIRLP